MVADLKVIDRVWEVLENRNIILYGASSGGKYMFQTLSDAGIEVMAFCDGNPDKKGTFFFGKPVISIDMLKEQAKDDSCCVIISSCYLTEILSDIEENGIECDVFSAFAVRWGLWFAMQEESDVPEKAKEYWRKKKQFVTVEKVCANTFSSTISGLSGWQMKNILFEENPYIAFQPAKVGSSSLCIELGEKGKNVIHLHDIALFFDEHPATEEEYELLTNAIKNVPNLKIITGVRDPIARDLSLVFSAMGDGGWFARKENIECDFLNRVEKGMLTNTSLLGVDKPVNYNWSDYIRMNSQYGAVFDWFDLEIKEFFDIDIFAEPFDKEKGCSVIRKGNIEIFVYKMEKLNELEQELREFLEIDDFTIQHKNNSEEKSYALTYQCTKEHIKLRQDYIDFYYKDNPRMRHFYTDDEINSFRKKWEKKVR